jgi:protein-S-isoprenylcysteine O-methyltransferase Ste14
MKKFLFTVYAVIAYIISLGALLYLLGFVSTLIVPKHIDSELQSPLGLALLINAGLILLFGLQHSIMARPAFKVLWTRYIPEPIERSTYILFSSLCLALLFWQWQPIGGFIWQTKSETMQIVLQAICLTGFAIAVASTFLIDHFDVFGLKQVWYYVRDKKYEGSSFKTPLFYQYVRHPLYVGLLITFWSTPTMTITHLFFAVITTGYILTGIKLEENDLIKVFGQRYQEYMRSMPMLIPFTKSDKQKKNQ